MKFGVGQPLRRKEDARFLTGAGRYLDDIQPKGAVFAHVLRSPYAHGRVVRVDASAARSAPGVRLVYTGAETASRLTPIRSTLPIVEMGGPECPPVEFPHLATDRVRYVGQPLALIVAETPDLARDAAELIEVEIEELPVVVDAKAALMPDAPELHATAPGNLVYDWAFGDAAETDAAFASAAHRVKTAVKNQRLIVTAMEPRGMIATYGDDQRWEVWICSQGPHAMRGHIARGIGAAPERVRVHAPDIGGAFGMKLMAHPEYAPIALAAKDLGAPVKWMADRSESFLSDVQARDLQTEIEGAFDAEGRLLAMRLSSHSNVGAYLSTAGPGVHSVFSANLVGGMYRLPVFHHRVRAALTNTTPTDAYRGAGRPEVIHCTERLMDAAARQIGIDPVALRRRNLVTAEDAPHQTLGGFVFDGQDPARLVDAALAAADYDGFEGRAAASTALGRIRGRAAIYYMERTGGAPVESAEVEIDAAGATTLRVGTMSTGQGHETTWPQVLVENLGLDFDAVTLAAGDSDRLTIAGGTGGSRSVIMASRAIKAAAEEVIRVALPAAAEALEAAPEDLEFSAAAAGFAVAGTDRRITLVEIAAREGGLSAAGDIEGRSGTYPNGCHVAEVEIDPETGALTLERYTLMDDFGVLVNPLIAGGQAQGGVAQGAGQALVEEAVYDPETGQPLAASFMDYVMPRADNFPSLEPNFIEVPTPANPYGVKGGGEAGTVAGIPAVTLAAHDALARVGGDLIEGPFTPERVWRAVNKRAG